MFEYWIKADLNKLAKVEQLTGRVFTQDSGANKIGVEFPSGITLTGTVKANIIKPNGTTVEVTGNKSGNRAWVVLPDFAYTHVGKLGVYIRIEDTDQTITLGGLESYVYPSMTGNILS